MKSNSSSNSTAETLALWGALTGDRPLFLAASAATLGALIGALGATFGDQYYFQ